MLPVYFLGQYQAAVLVSLDKRVQFWLECFSEDFPLFPFCFRLVPGVGEEMVEVNSEQSQGRQGESSDDDIIHIWFWLLS